MKLSEQVGRYPPYDAKSHKAGFDSNLNRFRNPEGKRISKASYLESYFTDTPSGYLLPRNVHPVSDALEGLEDIVGSAGASEKTRAKTFSQMGGFNRAWPIPPDILAAFRLAEYYYRTEGDIYHALNLPKELALSRDFTISCPSPDLKKELEELYDIDQLDMMGLIDNIWECDEVYSNTPVMILPSGANDSPIAGVTILNPKYVYIGSPPTSFFSVPGSDKSSTDQGTSGVTQYGLMSTTEKAWTVETLRNEIHPLAYNAFGPAWNEQVTRGMWVDLNPAFVTVIQAHKQRWERYALPHLSRAFRSISTRKMFEELRRATAEGLKNQLFIINIGDMEHPGSPEEVRYANSLFGAMAGERTGLVVWKGNMKGEVLRMEAVDSLTGNDTWHGLTLNIFRNLGINVKYISGESPSTSRTSPGGDEVDVRLFVERLRYKQRQIQRWERSFRLRLAQMWEGRSVKVSIKDEISGAVENKKNSMMEVMRKTSVTFQQPVVEMAEQIASYIMPVFTIGGMSIETMHEEAGLNHAVEVARRKREHAAGLDDLFAVRSSFSQQATDQGGGTTTHTQTDPGGRPSGAKDAKPRVRGSGPEDDYDPFSVPSLQQ